MPGERSAGAVSYRMFGMTQSYFTRKLTGHLDYKAIPYHLRRFARANRAALDAVLERAGIRGYFPDNLDQAGKVPSYEKPPRPALNRPFGPPWEREGAVR